MTKRIDIEDIESCVICMDYVECSLKVDYEEYGNPIIPTLCTEYGRYNIWPQFIVKFYDGTILDYALNLFINEGEVRILNEKPDDHIDEYKKAVEKYLKKYYPTKKEEQAEIDKLLKEKIIKAIKTFLWVDHDYYLYKNNDKYIIAYSKNNALGEFIENPSLSDIQAIAAYFFPEDSYYNIIEWGVSPCKNVEFYNHEIEINYSVDPVINVHKDNNKLCGYVKIVNAPKLIINLIMGGIEREYSYDTETKTFFETTVLQAGPVQVHESEHRLLNILKNIVNSANIAKLFLTRIKFECAVMLRDYLKNYKIYFKKPYNYYLSKSTINDPEYSDVTATIDTKNIRESIFNFNDMGDLFKGNILDMFFGRKTYFSLIKKFNVYLYHS